MNQVLWLLKWVLKAAIFFTLFAFALNNQQEVTVHFFFGTQWHTSLVLLVLIVFATGLGIGALGMVPRWWKQRRAARHAARKIAAAGPASNPSDAPPHGL